MLLLGCSGSFNGVARSLLGYRYAVARSLLSCLLGCCYTVAKVF